MATGREVEPRTLARSLAAEPQHTHGHTNLERASPARTGHLEKRGTRPADLRPKLAVVKDVQADAAPPQAGHESAAARATRRRRRSPSAEAASATANTPKSDDDARTARELEADAQRGGEKVRRRDSRGGLTVHEVPKLVEGRGADARDRVELFDGAERSVLGPVVENFLGGHGPDAGQLVELIERGGVEVDAAAYTRLPSLLRAPERPPVRRNDDLLTVRDGRSQVHERERGFRLRPSRRLMASSTRLPSGRL